MEQGGRKYKSQVITVLSVWDSKKLSFHPISLPSKPEQNKVYTVVS
jgi:hypothetical protein